MKMKMKNTTFIKPSKLSDDAITRVLIKLNELKGRASFDDTRWIFDWDDHRHQLENIDICNYELDALTTLQNNKVISFRYEATPDIQVFNHDGSGKLSIIRDYRENEDYKISTNRHYSPDADSAGLYFHTAVWITSFDIDRFNSYSEPLNIEFVKDRIMARLEMDSTIPVVTIGGIQYNMPSLKEGLRPALLIESAYKKCLQQNSKQVTIEKDELGMRFSNANFSQILKGGPFGNSKPLSPFILSSSKGKMIFSTSAALSVAQEQAIRDKGQVI